MTDQLDYTAKIRAKGCAATGITEDIAREMHSRKGAHYMGIVELKVDETHEKAEGQNKVDLVLVQVEPATDKALDEHLRQLTRTLHQNRVLNAEDAQLAIDTQDDLEPTVEQVIAAREAEEANDRGEPLPGDEPDPDDPAYEPHEFVDTPSSECEICQQPAGAAVHTADREAVPAGT